MIPPLKTPEGAFKPPADGWIHISPLGVYPVTLRRGEDDESDTAIVIDAASCAAQAAAFRASPDHPANGGGGMLCDYDHFSLDSSRSSEAAGWIEDLDARADGLWARIRWTDGGLAAISGGRFRYASPVHMPSDCDQVADGLRPRVLASLALTNTPRMLQGLCRMRPISSRVAADAADDPSHTPPTPAPSGKEGSDMDYKTMLLEHLGLPAEATDEDIASAAEVLKAKAAEAEAEKTRADEAETKLAGLEADGEMDKLEDEGYPIASRETLRERLVADRAGTLTAIRALRIATAAAKPGADEPLRSRAEARTPAADASSPDMATQRAAIVHKIIVRDGLASRAQATARAQHEHPELWA